MAGSPSLIDRINWGTGEIENVLHSEKLLLSQCNMPFFYFPGASGQNYGDPIYSGRHPCQFAEICRDQYTAGVICDDDGHPLFERNVQRHTVQPFASQYRGGQGDDASEKSAVLRQSQTDRLCRGKYGTQDIA